MVDDDVVAWLESRNAEHVDKAVKVLAARQLVNEYGCSYRQVAELLGVSHQFVYRAVSPSWTGL